MTIDLILLTYNRLDYTKLSLASILADASEEFALTIWDNASTDGTAEYLRNEVKDPRIKRIVYSKKNVGQIVALNEVWGESRADLVGKLDNDCLMSPGWTRTLAQAHQDIAELGVVACWHFFPEDFDLDRARRKIQAFGRHQILRHPWTCGTGLLVKRSTYARFGPMHGQGTTDYWLKMALAGFVNGFYFPLIHQEHMDDLRSKHNRMHSMSFEQAYQYNRNACPADIKDRESYLRLHEKILENLLTGPYDPAHYTRRRWKRLWKAVKSLVAGSKNGGDNSTV